MSTIPCDFCPHPVDRGQMEEIEISHYVPDSSGEDLAYARTYFFGHPAPDRHPMHLVDGLRLRP
jgi:hypothetical protein